MQLLHHWFSVCDCRAVAFTVWISSDGTNFETHRKSSNGKQQKKKKKNSHSLPQLLLLALSYVWMCESLMACAHSNVKRKYNDTMPSFHTIVQLMIPMERNVMLKLFREKNVWLDPSSTILCFLIDQTQLFPILAVSIGKSSEPVDIWLSNFKLFIEIKY